MSRICFKKFYETCSFVSRNIEISRILYRTRIPALRIEGANLRFRSKLDIHTKSSIVAGNLLVTKSSHEHTTVFAGNGVDWQLVRKTSEYHVIQARKCRLVPSAKSSSLRLMFSWNSKVRVSRKREREREGEREREKETRSGRQYFQESTYQRTLKLSQSSIPIHGMRANNYRSSLFPTTQTAFQAVEFLYPLLSLITRNAGDRGRKLRRIWCRWYEMKFSRDRTQFISMSML